MAGATLMPMVMNAQTKAAKTEAIWLREERVIFTFLSIWPDIWPFGSPDHSGYAKVDAGSVPVSIKQTKRIT
jgi:hypothetical protein